MDRELLAHFPVVLAVARRGGFASAAAELGMSPSAVSHAVRTVEERIGLPLFARTTRSVSLSEAGRAFAASIGPAIAEIGDTLERLRASGGEITGLLRLNVPRVALQIALTPVIATMGRRYPQLTIEIICDEALVDIVAASYDAGVRLGEMISEDMIAVRLTPPFKAIMVASPAYIAANGKPLSITQLGQHNCIGFRLLASGAVYAWELQDKGVAVAAKVRGTALVSDSLYAKELALAGVGIAYLFEPLVREEIRRRQLKCVLAETAIEEPGLFLYFPRRAAQAPKLRAFIDTARDVLQPTSSKRARVPAARRKIKL